MRKIVLIFCSLLSVDCWAQNIVSNPTGSQKITQPTPTEFSVNRFEAVRYADQFSGSDIGAQVNAAYDDCPSTGCRIKIPAGTYTYTTDINIGTSGKPALIECDPGVSSNQITNTAVTELKYNATSGVAVTLNTGAGSRIAGCTLEGNGISNAGTSVGLVVGGSNGNVYGSASDVDISNFNVGLQFANNVYISRFDNLTVHDNATSNILFPTGISQTGENISFFGGALSNKGSSYSTTCVDIQSGILIAFHNLSLEQCGVTVGATSVVDFIGAHWENPNGSTAADYLTIGANPQGSPKTGQ